jgi:hypothetical protein
MTHGNMSFRVKISGINTKASFVLRKQLESLVLKRGSEELLYHLIKII